MDVRPQDLKRLHVCTYHSKNELSAAGRIRIVPTLRKQPGEITKAESKVTCLGGDLKSNCNTN